MHFYWSIVLESSIDGCISESYISISLLWLLLLDFVSGSEAMFADLCYFSVRSVQVKMLQNGIIWIRYCYITFDKSASFGVSFLIRCCYWYDSDVFDSDFLQLTFMFLVLPCLLLGYLGQAAYLMDNHSGAEQVFFNCIPSKLRFLSPSMCKVFAILWKWISFVL